VNFNLLDNAIAQVGPWTGRGVKTDAAWLVARLEEKIRSIDWPAARDDVRRFIPLRQQASLDAWGVDYFLYLAGRLRGRL